MRKLLLLLLLSAGPVAGQVTLPDAATVAEVLRRADNYWIASNGVGNAGWARGAYYTGNQRALRVLGEHAYHDWAVAWGGVNQWRIGPEGAGNADAYCCGQTYIDLYRLHPQTNYLADIKAKTDALVASANVAGWSWIDAFYMQGPVLARLGKLTGDTNYYQKLWLMYDDMMTRRGLFDVSAALWYRDANYFYPAHTTANGQKIFWSRGNGWVFAGLARVLQEMPANAPHYADYVTMFQNMAPALQALQGVDGLWRASLHDAAEFPNPETSGTGFFTYGFAWGVRHGLLPAASYTNTIIQAWQGLTNLSLNAAGLVGYVQGVGAQPAATTAGNTTDFGVGAFLLAASEIYLLAADAPALRPWAGANQTLLDTNGDGQEPITLDASTTEIYSGTAVSYTWWEGAGQIASGVTVPTNLALGQHVITVKVVGSDSVTYTDSMTVNVITPPVIPPPVLALSFNFEDSGITTTDSVAGVSLNLLNASAVATDLHGALGSGVGGAGRALDLTSAASQGGNGPLASTVGNSTINFGTLDSFAMTLWIKPGSSLLIANFPRYFTLGTNGTTDRGNGSLQLLSNGNFQPATSVQGFVNAFQTSTSGFGTFDLPANQWRFMALTYDGATLNFYGGSESNAVVLMSSTSFVAGTISLGGSWSLFLGNRLDRTRAFRGLMDDVRFYRGTASLDYLETVRQSAVAPPPISAALAGTNLMFRTATRLGLSYVLQSAPDLTPPPVWTPVSTNPGSGGPITNLVFLNPAQPQKFFRYLIR